METRSKWKLDKGGREASAVRSDKITDKARMDWLDSLRIFAMALVIIYHFFPQKLPAGFLGVDILFVLSGFLVTSLALDEFSDEGKFSLGEFYQRRVVRILPNVLLLVLLVLPFALLANPDFLVDIQRQLAAVFGFSTNLYEIASGGSYESQYVKHLFLHTWSLGPEVHFYILWGFCIWLLSRNRQKNRKQSRMENRPFLTGKLRYEICLLSMVLFMGMSILQGVLTLAGTSTAFRYFSDLTRMAPFFMGSFVAGLTGFRNLPAAFVRLGEKSKKMASFSLMLVLPVLCLLCAVSFRYDSKKTYLLAFPTVALLVGLYIYRSRLLSVMGAQGWEGKTVHFLSRMTYPLYLFHWPYFVLLSRVMSRPPAAILAILLAFFCSLLAEFFWQPLFFHKELGLWKKHTLSSGLSRGILGLASALLLLFCVLSAKTEPQLLEMEERVWANGLDQDQETLYAIQQNISEKSQKAQAAKKEREQAQLNQSLEKLTVTVIGDSVSLVVRNSLKEQIKNISIDSAVSRFLHDGVAVMKQKEAEGSLGHFVIIELGTNIYPDFEKQFQRIIDACPKGHRLVFVSPYDKSKDQEIDSVKYTDFLRKVKKPPFVTIADWAAIAQQHPAYYTDTDGVHFYGKKEAISQFTKMIQDALKESIKKPAKS